tara:strand:+ start:1023 stop:1436 length:414 start_codon:yes stop_codon:yes gene_type:complete
MKKILLIILLSLACITNSFSNEIIYKKCIQGRDGTLMDDRKNKEGIRIFDKYLVKINLEKNEVYHELYWTKEILDSAKKKNPDFKMPKIPKIRTFKIIYADDNQINYLDDGTEYKIYLSDKEIRVKFMEPDYYLKCE